MATAPQESNIGASRLIGTNGLDQAVSSLTTQVNKMSSDFANLSASINKLTGNANRTMGGSGSSWNTGSNRNTYSGNGGGGSFSGSGRSQTNGRSNGGGFVYSAAINRGMSSSSAGKLSAAGALIGGTASALVNYGNSNMSDIMQRDMFGTTAARLGGVGSNFNQANAVARRAVFSNNNSALNATDAAQAGYINTYSFGQAAQNNGVANPLFASQQKQVMGFGYNSPTLGATGAATAYQESHTARALAMSQAFGIKAPIGVGGVQNSMGSIAQSIMARAQKPGFQYTTKNMASALGQGGGLNVSLQAMGSAMGWSQSTIQEYQNYMVNQVAAQAKGISASQFDTLTTKAQANDKGAQATLKKALGTSAFQTQMNLNATTATRANDIQDSFVPAFNKATDAVNQFSTAVTAMLKQTGMDKVIGTGSGILTPLSNAASGASNGFGTAAGAYGAYRLFQGARGMMAGRTAASAAADAGLGARTASGAYNITTLGGEAAAGGAGVAGMTTAGIAGAGAGVLGLGAAGWMTGTKQTSTMGQALQFASASNPISGIAGKSRQLWDKLHGKNSDSWLDLWLNPFSANNNTGRAGGGISATKMDGSSGGVTGNSVGNGSANVGANAASVIKYAETQLGVPYVWGGENPGKGMDCSGLTQWAYSKAGVKIPRVAADQQSASSAVDKNKTQPGDLLFVGNPAHHVVMNAGGGQIIEAPHTGANVRLRSLNPGEFDSAGRYVGAIGNMNSLLNGNTSGGTNSLSSSQSRAGGDVGAFGSNSEAANLSSALSSLGGTGAMPPSSGGTGSISSAGSTATGTAPKGNGLGDKSSLQAYAKQLLSKYGWAGQWNSFNALEMSEAGWDIHATNPSSGAYGLPQSLPASKMKSAGADWKTNGDTQLQWMMDYIKGRYGSPDAAWSFHQKNNWYDQGAWSIDKDQKAVVHQGEMIIPAQQAETIRQTLLNNSFNPNKSSSSSGGGSMTFGNINVNLPAGYTGTAQEAQLTGKMIVKAMKDEVRNQLIKTGQ